MCFFAEALGRRLQHEDSLMDWQGAQEELERRPGMPEGRPGRARREPRTSQERPGEPGELARKSQKEGQEGQGEMEALGGDPP